MLCEFVRVQNFPFGIGFKINKNLLQSAVSYSYKGGKRNILIRCFLE